jgi:hypothetical protein
MRSSSLMRPILSPGRFIPSFNVQRWRRLSGYSGPPVDTIAVLFLLGLALEAIPIMIMLIPVLAPAAAAYRIDPHHLGLVIVMTVQTALLSPPVALSLSVVAS